MKTNTYTETLYRVILPDGPVKYACNNTIGVFEFRCKKSARNYIKEQKLKGSKIEQEDILTIVETDGPDYTRTIETTRRKVI